MGNLLMMEPLLSLFKEFKQSQMATTASQSLFLSTMKQPSPQPFSSKKIIAQTQADISDPYILAHGENTTQKFNINIQSMQNKDHFISSNYVMSSLTTKVFYIVFSAQHKFSLIFTCNHRIYRKSILSVYVISFPISLPCSIPFMQFLFLMWTFFSHSFSLFPVYALGYKNVVKAWYEKKLQEARVNAQQEAQYPLKGDVCLNCMKQSFREFLRFSFVWKLLMHQNKCPAFFPFFINLDHHNRS